MEFRAFWAVISSVITVIVFLPYLRDIFRKKTQPHMYSWLIWGILQLIATFAVLKDGSGWGALSIGLGGLFCLSIFCLSFKYGTKNIKKFDLFCLIAALLTIVIYLTINDPIYSVLLVVLIDFIAFLPTYRKSYEEPYTETLSTYALSATGNLISILAVQHYSVTTVLYLITLFLTNSALVFILIVKRRSSASLSIARKYLNQKVSVRFDRPLGSKHPKHGFVYEVNYGYLPGIKAPDGDDVDAYYLGVDKPLEQAEGTCIAIIHRTDDDDDKLVIVPAGISITDEEIMRAVAFQERYFKSKVIRK